MRNTSFTSLVLSSFIITACSVETTSPPSSESKPASTAPGTEPSESAPPPKAKPAPAQTEEEDPKAPAPKAPPTPFFDATLDGDDAIFDETSIELDDGKYKLVGVVNATSPYGSDMTLTVRMAKGETGTAACASGKRSVDLWYKDEDGAIRGIGTSYQYGNCTMKLDTSIPGYVSGEAQGTLGGAKQKSFTVKFAQKLP